MKNRPIVEVDGAQILFLPCETYNFSPENEIASVRTGLHDKFLLHFKGPRKQLMKLFWDAHLLPRTRYFPFGVARSWMARWKLAHASKATGTK